MQKNRQFISHASDLNHMLILFSSGILAGSSHSFELEVVWGNF